MQKLVINRSEWARGREINYSGMNYLWHYERNSGCCLGHVCIKLLGQEKADMDAQGMPKTVFLPGDNFLVDELEIGNAATKNSAFSKRAACINDSEAYTEEQREKALIELFHSQNIELSFEG